MHIPTSKIVVFAVLGVAVLGVLGGCGDDDDESTSATATAGGDGRRSCRGRGPAAVDGAVTSCTDAASALEREAVKNTATTGCQEVGQALNQQVASLSDSARADVDSALEQLNADCRKQAATLSEPVQPLVLTACDKLVAAG